MGSRPDRGQATVELALVLPVLVAVILISLQVVAVMRDSLALGGAGRAAARLAIVETDLDRVRSAAVAETKLDPSRLVVEVRGEDVPGGFVTVTLTYRSPSEMALVGRLIGDITLTETFVVRRE